MSDHWVEDLVEQSVRLLDSRYPADDLQVRCWIGALYRVQAQHDCSFTHLRVMDILLRRGFAVRFPPVEHPDCREVPLIDVLQAIEAAGEASGDRTLIADWRELEPDLCDLYGLGV
ncbi:hypothetical protein [Streptomyces sp. 4F14]|uniref:hypothetical protein n=1 Tax=Streptomyces sp. 4F14 TaxID=3394380 RepID=UPI003A87AD5A